MKPCFFREITITGESSAFKSETHMHLGQVVLSFRLWSYPYQTSAFGGSEQPVTRMFSRTVRANRLVPDVDFPSFELAQCANNEPTSAATSAISAPGKTFSRSSPADMGQNAGRTKTVMYLPTACISDKSICSASQWAHCYLLLLLRMPCRLHIIDRLHKCRGL